MIFNYFMQANAYEYNDVTGTFRVNFDRVKEATRKLTGQIMTLQAHGDYEGARRLLDSYAVVEGPLQRTLAKLTAIPVDIVPVQSEGN
jgi:hypothetical protein